MSVSVNPLWWSRPELQEALRRRDVPAVYRFLGSRGFSQTRIARLTQQSQTEVWEIASRGRDVVAYDVLARIADGLGIPRGLMGLAYTQDTAVERTSGDQQKGRHVKRRELLGMAAKITVGASLTGADLATLATPAGASPVPDRLGPSDVHRLQAMTASLEAHDRAHGGGACRDAILGYLNWAIELRHTAMDDDVRRSLDTALAELECLAGWTSYDMRLHDAAEHFLLRAAHSAQLGEQPLLIANAVNKLGWVYSRDGHYGDALRAFQFAGITASEVGSPRLLACIALSEAELHGRRGDAASAHNALRRGHDEYSRADDPAPPARTLMLDDGKLHQMTAEAYSDLAHHHPELAAQAIEHAKAAAAVRQDPSQARGLLSARITLALNHYRCGDTTTANEQAALALHALPQVSSRRVLASLSPLVAAAAAHGDSTATDLAHRLRAHCLPPTV